MAASFETLSQRIFNDAHELTPLSPCPTMDVVLLAASSGEKLGLWRVAGRAGLVWSKERAGVSVESFCWSPDGHVIAVTRQHQQSGDGEGEAAPATELELCSVHDCSPVAPKVLLPQFSGAASPSQSHSKRKKKSNAACLAWLQLPEQPLKAIEAEDLIRRLPALGSVPKKNPADKSKTPASMRSYLLQHSAPSSSHVIAQKVASFKLDVKCPRYPQLPQARSDSGALPTTKGSASSVSAHHVNTLLVHATEGSRGLSLLLAGSCNLGSVLISEQPLTCHPLTPSATAHPHQTHTDFGLLCHSGKQLLFRRMRLTLPSVDVQMLARASTTTHDLLAHVYNALGEPMAEMQDSVDIGQKWIAKIADTNAAHGLKTTPQRQLMLLLLDGKADVAMQEVLAGKMAERNLARWSTALKDSAGTLRKAAYQCVVPSIERVILWLDEMRAWALAGNSLLAPDAVSRIDRLILLSQHVILKASQLERAAREDYGMFVEFAKWIKYETDILAAREAQSERPMAKYDVLTAAAFIKNGATTSELSSIFAPPTEADLESATEPAPLFMPLEQTLSEALDQLEEGKPLTPAEPLTAASVPSIPTLLDRLSREMSELFESSLQNFAASVEKQDGIVLGNVSAAHLRARPDEGGCLYFAFTHKAPGNSPLLLWICRIVETQFEAIPVSLSSEGTTIEHIDHDFFDDLELALLGRISAPGQEPEAFLATIDYRALDWEHAVSQVAKTPAHTLNVRRWHSFGNQVHPQGLALNGRKGRRIACVLGGQGLQLEVLDLEEGGDEEDDPEEPDMEAEGEEAVEGTEVEMT